MQNKSINTSVKNVIKVLVLVVVLTLSTTSLSACLFSKNETPQASDSVKNPIKVYGCEPQFPLVTTNTTETCGGDVLDVIYEGLVSYNTDGSVENIIAKSIETTDNQHYSITLNDGYTFSNGEKVIAQNFVDAWNFGAVGKYAQGSSIFFNLIEGFDDVQADKADKLSGLEVVDDTHFNVTLTNPSVTFPLRLGFLSFMPLPKAAFNEDGSLVEGFGDNPITNGPYKFESWTHDQSIKVTPFEGYTGPHKPQNGGIDFVVYSGGTEAAYADIQSGALDVLSSVPQSHVKTFRTDENVVPYVKPGNVFQGLAIPAYLKHFGYDEEGKLRRAAVSLSINRQEIIDTISDGTAVVPTGFCPKNEAISGCANEIEGSDVLKFDADKAKELWAKADEISKFDNPTLLLQINGDGGGKALFEAIVNQISNNLGINCSLELTPDFKTLLNIETSKTATGAFRSGWQADYPSVENYLTSLYMHISDNNYTEYNSEEFEGLIQKALVAHSLSEANDLFGQAQAVLFKDLPIIPLHDAQTKFVTAKGVGPAELLWNGVPNYTAISK